MNSLHRQKDQKNYSVGIERHATKANRALIGLHYVAESKRGKVIASSWVVHTDEDGTIYKLNTRIREYTNQFGTLCKAVDHTLIVSNVGEATKAEVAASKSKLMHTTIGVVCMNCLTSDHIKDDKDGYGHTCTRCNNWIKNA